jgi:ribose transport system permease protein
LLHEAERFGVLLLLVAVVVLFSALETDTFATAANFRNVATSNSVLAVVALAIVVPLTGGRFDVSVGNIVSVSAITCAALTGKHGIPLLPAAAISVALGTALGLTNGLIVAYLGVNSIIATLGTGTIMGGLVQAYTGGVPLSDGIPGSLTDLASRTVLGVPRIFIVMLVVSGAVWFLITQTPFGRRLLAIGSNQSSARLTGLDVPRAVTLSFVAAGGVAGVGGVMQLAAQGSGDPSVGGLSFILPGLAAVFLGATTWEPGRFNVPGTLLALFFVGTTVAGLTLAGGGALGDRRVQRRGGRRGHHRLGAATATAYRDGGGRSMTAAEPPAELGPDRRDLRRQPGDRSRDRHGRRGGRVAPRSSRRIYVGSSALETISIVS